VLLRLGRYSVAVYRGDRLLSAKTSTRYVKGRHHAGGTSQRRFQRIREGQIRRLYDAACLVTQSQFSPFAHELDYILLGGERFTLNGFLKACSYLEQFQGITLGRRLNIRDPKHDTLEQVAGMLRESRVYQFQW
jgi:peptide subunit release factor 1 (eRF1)